MIATLVYTTPKTHETDANQISRFGTVDIYEPDVAGNFPVTELLGLPVPPAAGVADTTIIAPPDVQRTIAYNLADPGLATFVSRFPTTAAQLSALQGLFTGVLEAITGCAVTAAPVTIV